MLNSVIFITMRWGSEWSNVSFFCNGQYSLLSFFTHSFLSATGIIIYLFHNAGCHRIFDNKNSFSYRKYHSNDKLHIILLRIHLLKFFVSNAETMEFLRIILASLLIITYINWTIVLKMRRSFKQFGENARNPHWSSCEIVSHVLTFQTHKADDLIGIAFDYIQSNCSFLQ